MSSESPEKALLEPATISESGEEDTNANTTASMSSKHKILQTLGISREQPKKDTDEEPVSEEIQAEEIVSESPEKEPSLTPKIISEEKPKIRPWFFYDVLIDVYDPLAELPAAQSSTVSNAQKTTGTSTAQSAALVESLRPTDELPPLKSPVFSQLGYTGTLTPDTSWSAFAPADINNLETAYGRYAAEKAPGVNEDDYPVNKTEIHEEDDMEEDKEPETVVGINRLYIAKFSQEGHIVMPLYWRTVGDACNVRRSVWFFRSTMGPVERSLERHLEEAFNLIKPWTSQYVEELEAAVSNPEAECRFKHTFTYRVKDGAQDPPIEVAVVFSPCALFEGEKEPRPKAHLLFPSYFNIFGAAPSTALLATSLLHDRPIPGYHVSLQRFFDWTEYKKYKSLPDRPIDSMDYEYAKITKLVFVLHGIGQKLSERVASFTFTFAINHFRVLVKEQLMSPRTKNCLDSESPDENSIAILPVNWRRLVDFENLGSMYNGSGTSGYSLKDITVNSIPSVRRLIGDVLLDIPYYMSHHRPLLLHAAATEANRIYKIFCKYNPGFDGDGSVHMIGHSLGSVIALDLLSFQPTHVNKDDFQDTDTPDVSLNLKSPPTYQINSQDIPHLCFNTSNLFIVGSPVGFFMLLHHATFKSRGNGNGPQYGCLAVNNLYNVINFSDPIAYLLNPAVDKDLATRIETANVPSEKDFPLEGEENEAWIKFPKFPFWSPSSTPVGEREEAVKEVTEQKTEESSPNMRPRSDSAKSDKPVSSRLMGIFSSRPRSPLSPKAKKTETAGSPASPKTPEVPIFTPTPVNPTAGLEGSLIGDGSMTSSPPPTNIPLKDRDSAAEHAAKEEMKRLNDNGQLDWIVPLTGALENQYLSMVTAHSNYWDNKDLARMCAIECCRKPGPENTIEQLRVRMKPRVEDTTEA